ncbi:protein spire homolog 1 isoform X2 [Trichomycterus rosablanca]|uniref:protein spire homolog 1 isoform X2 n=1 Tax=Trichomycterus rosablanca TaxID=2290929 RepID=UPI002F350ABC
MAKSPGKDGGAVKLISAPAVEPPEPGVDSTDGEDLCLEEILTLYSQPINEEQAWAVCYQCCQFLVQFKHRRRNKKKQNIEISGVNVARRIEGPGDVRINKDGTVTIHPRNNTDKHTQPNSSTEVIESLGIMIYKALDYGLKDNEERELSPPLEQLINLMTNMAETETDVCSDEGYEATEEEDEGDEETTDVSSIKGYRDIMALCTSHLPSSSDAPNHYQAVCRALYAETKELRTFLEKIKTARENLRRMEVETHEKQVRDLNDLQNADWARFWVQVMRDLRTGIKLKKVQERQYDPLPIEYQLTPYEMLMNDIRSKRYTLRKVMVSGDIPPRLKKSAHEIILEFIRSRPPLNPVSARKLKPHPLRPPSLHERILEEIKAERKLKPVSPDMIRRSRLGSSTPDTRKKIAVSTLALADDTDMDSADSVDGAQPRRKLLKAPALAELESSDSGSEDEPEPSTRRSVSSSSISTSVLDDTSPDSIIGRRTPPRFRPVSSTSQPDLHIGVPRRHSVEREVPNSIRPFVPPFRQNTRSLEEFRFPVECMSLTVEEVMHIRQVLVKAELEKYQHYKDIYTALKKGKLCFSCRTKRFSIFTWSYTCQFCKRPVCSQCCKKMKLPSKPSKLPIHSLGSSPLLKKESGDSTQLEETSSNQRNSWSPSTSRLSNHSQQKPFKDGELEFPKELTEGWNTMDVCTDCKKFITDIICSSKRSSSMASSRARLKRKTQSFYMSSSRTRDYRPSERTIKEV